MKKNLTQILKSVISQKWGIEVVPKVEISENLHYGDYTCNIAMILAKQLKNSPIKIAEVLIEEIRDQRLMINE